MNKNVHELFQLVSSDVSTTVSTINLLPDGSDLNSRNRHRHLSMNSSSDDDIERSIENNRTHIIGCQVEINEKVLKKTSQKQITKSTETDNSASSSSPGSPATVVVDIEDLINTKLKDEAKM